MKNLKSMRYAKHGRIKGYRTSLLEPVRKGPQESSVVGQMMGATELGRIFQLCRAEFLSGQCRRGKEMIKSRAREKGDNKCLREE